MVPELLILLSGTLLTLFLGSVTLSSDRKNATNQLFFLLSLVISAWSLLSFVSTIDNKSGIVLVRIIMALVVVMNTLYGLIIVYSPERNLKKIIKHEKYPLIFTGFVIAVALSPLLFVGLDRNAETTSPVPGPGMLLFLLHVGYFVLYSVFRLAKRISKSDKFLRPQLLMLALGAFILFVITPILNFVLPVVLSNSVVIRYSPVFMALFSLTIFYSVVKHRLFDLRVVAARAIGYTFSVLFITVTSVSLAYLLKVLLFPNLRVDTNQLISNIILTVFLVLVYPIFKKIFDKITNHLFFRDSYDTQVFIDELNKSLVNNVVLESLLTKIALIFQEQLKTSFATFYIHETSYFKPRIIGAHRSAPEYQGMEKLQEYASIIGRRVIVADESHKNDEEKQLKKILVNNEIDVMARLVNTLDYNVKGIGYLFLGQKKNGTTYSNQDLKIIEIVANELVIAIENVLRFEEIEQFNVTLQKKIDDATKELKQTNEKLRALDEAKDEFVSMASHQLRTPLTSIKGYISMVLEGDAGDINETQKKMLGQAFFSSQRMVYLISDLLNVSRLKTGKFIIETKPVYLPDVVESEISQLIEGASTKNLTLSFTKPKTFATMSLDEMKLRQVIMNFTDNAIYYTPAGGKITVELKETAKSIEFTVKDSGIGVPKEQQQKLFTKFYRADNARKARPDGTGLGLFMAKKVIIAQGGSVVFDSKEGKGSTFGFTFPKERLEVKAEPTEKSKDKTE